MPVAVVCGSGGYRTVFIHGVLSALEAAGFRADAYGGTSASGLAAAAAAVGMTRSIGIDYWDEALRLKSVSPRGMSDVMLTSIAQWTPVLTPHLFQPDTPRYVIPASYVKDASAAATAQSSEARRLGRKLVLAAARREPSAWVQQSLETHLFDTAPGAAHPLTAENLGEVLYASTRMMHAWDVPATIGGLPYVDASYLCAIPALELAAEGYTVIAISADPPGSLYRDIFGTQIIPDAVGAARIHKIMPALDPGPQGADFTDATHEGLRAVYEQGMAKGRAFLDNNPLAE